MGQLVLVVVAAAWAAVLLPPLLRSRLDNRPNSSVTDFRNQLSSLQKAMPSRSVTVRSMGRPLTSSPLSRPAAGGRPALRSGVSALNGSVPRPKGHGTTRPPAASFEDPGPRPRRHGERPAHRRRAAARAPQSEAPVIDGVKRRRANVLFLLAFSAACTLFLAATMKVEALYYVFGATFVVLCGYVYVLGQRRQRQLSMRDDRPSAPAPAPAPQRVRSSADYGRVPSRRRTTTPRRPMTPVPTTTPLQTTTPRPVPTTPAALRRLERLDRVDPFERLDREERWSHAV